MSPAKIMSVFERLELNQRVDQLVMYVCFGATKRNALKCNVGERSVWVAASHAKPTVLRW